VQALVLNSSGLDLGKSAGTGAELLWDRSWITEERWITVSYCTLFGLQTNGSATVNANSTRARMHGCLGLFGLSAWKYRSGSNAA
jgi:regulator of sigma D